jgi:hypothetical protein
MGLIKSETDRATIVLSPKSIEISFISNSKTAIHKVVFKTDELTMYRYNLRDEDGNLLPEYPLAVDTAELFNTTKGIGRRDGIRMYWLVGDSKINVQPIKSSTKDPGRAGALFVNILNLEYTRYDVGTSYNTEPNVRVQAKDFADLCSQASTLRCSALEVVGHSNAVTFKGIMPSNSVASINRFVSQNESTTDTAPRLASNISDLDRFLSVGGESGSGSGLSLQVIKAEDLLTVRIPIATVKALSKIHNISPAGTLLRFYFAEGMPTKVESPIGVYGTYTICFRPQKL